MKYLYVLLGLFIFQLLYFWVAKKFNIVDKPNGRSSHSSVTLLGGGVIFYFATLMYFILNHFQYPWFFTGLTLITIVSFYDDIKPLSQKVRLLVHLGAVMILLYQLDFFTVSWLWLWLPLILFFAIGILNAYNFMDGINGMTGAYNLLVLGVFVYINTFIINFIDPVYLHWLILSLIVFNIFNFRKQAKCFAGDVGAFTMGFIMLFFIALLIQKSDNFAYLGLFLIYGIDSALTILHRIKLRENILLPHRMHLFQILANELKIPHLYISSSYAVLQLLISCGLIVFIDYGIIYMVVVSFVFSLTYFLLMRKFFKLHHSTVQA